MVVCLHHCDSVPSVSRYPPHPFVQLKVCDNSSIEFLQQMPTADYHTLPKYLVTFNW
ncbi:hypothetical protein VFPPC_15870 [Pochonia chlamydosporia 170]|uniref:Uncharacterized protein n=1 Tax=Pochonia chlamydosporia 170 TaxID=1380566 RepID=A0A179FSZ2_METCM|nr:hypothetical protein VFPPC_15870 [Pochonia chlamydosporia 170]OAQ68735.1 hypothetical protein VFPPC_15870 [Pochonia chlamydosporia 170]